MDKTLRYFLMLCGIFALIELGLLFHESRKLADDARAVMAETQEAIKRIDERIDGTSRNLNAILIQAGLIASRFEDLSRGLEDTAAEQKAYWAELKTRTLQSLDGADQAVASLEELIRNTDVSLNARLSPNAETALISANDLLQRTAAGIQANSNATLAAIESANRAINSPQIAESLSAAQSSLQHIDMVAAYLEQAAAELPSTARSIEEIAATSSRFRVWVLLSQIGSAISRALF